MVRFSTDLSSCVMRMGALGRNLETVPLLSWLLLRAMLMRESSNSLPARAMDGSGSVGSRLLAWRLLECCWLCLFLCLMLLRLSFWRVRSVTSSWRWQSRTVLASSLFCTRSYWLVENSLRASFLKQSSSLLRSHTSSLSFLRAILRLSSSASALTSACACPISSLKICSTSCSWLCSAVCMCACTSSRKELILAQVAAISSSLRCRAGFTIFSKKLRSLPPIEFLSRAPSAPTPSDPSLAFYGLSFVLSPSLTAVRNTPHNSIRFNC